MNNYIWCNLYVNDDDGDGDHNDDNDEEKLDASENCTSLPANLDAGYPLHAMTQSRLSSKEDQ